MSSNKKPASKEVMPEKPTRATKKKAMPVVAAGSKPDVEDNNAERNHEEARGQEVGRPCHDWVLHMLLPRVSSMQLVRVFPEARPAHRRQKHGQSGRAR